MAASPDRYSRQARFSGIGIEGQQKIEAARVAIVGCGALGTFQASALARAGVQELRLIDRDYVEWSNLQRQWLFEEADAEEALPKAIAAANHLRRINSTCQVIAEVADLTPGTVTELLEGVDVILDGTDNFETRYLINDFAVAESIPWIYGAAVGSYGLTMAILPGETACLRCVYPDPPRGAQPTCETAGVVNAIPSLIASLQVAAALRVITGGPVDGRMTTIDIWPESARIIAAPGRDPDCPCCARREFVYRDGARRRPISLCGRNAVQIHERQSPINLVELAEQLRPLAPVRANEFALRFFPDPYELTIFPDGRAIIKGTTDTGIARGLYARYVGQ
jgi:molybdopterin/thiamine biosynthesis adenylyltransferase